MFGKIAKHYGYYVQVQVLHSNAGYYIGTHLDGTPLTRESNEYYKSKVAANRALVSGSWTQRNVP